MDEFATRIAERDVLLLFRRKRSQRCSKDPTQGGLGKQLAQRMRSSSGQGRTGEKGGGVGWEICSWMTGILRR